MSAIQGYQDVLARIPEKRPVLMVDRYERSADGKRVRGIKAVSMGEELFLGHFPGTPIMPGVLQVAAMAQLGGLLIPRREGEEHLLPWITGLQRVKFRKPVVPGDLLVIDAWVVDNPEPGGAGTCISAQTTVNGEITCQGTIRLALVHADTLRTPASVLLTPLPELTAAVDQVPMTVLDIMKLIPHRFPFLLIDKILHKEMSTMRMVGVKNVTGNEPFFAGLPVPAVPGFLQVEMAAQVGCVLAFSLPENAGKLGFFMAIDDAKFHHPVVPGDQLVIDTVAVLRSRFGKGEARLTVGDRLVSEVAIKFAIVDRGEAGGGV
jgi:3-hydroxyacyl-[acyl-carrier-protein] dehydratase